MGVRYDNRATIKILKDYYKSALQRRNLKDLTIFKTPVLNYPTAEQADHLNLIRHTWSTGDRFYKLAYKHYGDQELWWVIAFFNQKPTESHLSLGDTVLVPLNLELMLEILGV
jgi:hypothetical protein|tara:strand:- start:361 stop:699 length:339 start_codon:yes stop_codon:yes gene_type:complete